MFVLVDAIEGTPKTGRDMEVAQPRFASLASAFKPLHCCWYVVFFLGFGFRSFLDGCKVFVLLPYQGLYRPATFYDVAMVQKQWYHFGIGASPISVYFSRDWDVHWGYGVLTHAHVISSSCQTGINWLDLAESLDSFHFHTC